MRRKIWIISALLVSVLLTGCQSRNLNRVELNEEDEKVSENQMWLPITDNENEKNECLLYDYFNHKIVAYNLKKKQISSVNELDNFFQYCFYTDSDIYTSGHSTEGYFKIVKKEENAVRQLLAINDQWGIFPCGCDAERNLYFFTKSYDAEEKKRRIVQFKNGELIPYKKTGGNMIDGLLSKDTLYYTVYDENKDCYFMRSIDIKNYDCVPKEYEYKLDDSTLFEYKSQLYAVKQDKIVNLKNNEDSYDKKSFNYFDTINNKLVQIDINADALLELSIVDLESHKEEFAVGNPVSFICKKGLITIYCDGQIEEYRIGAD